MPVLKAAKVTLSMEEIMEQLVKGTKGPTPLVQGVVAHSAADLENDQCP